MPKIPFSLTLSVISIFPVNLNSEKPFFARLYPIITWNCILKMLELCKTISLKSIWSGFIALLGSDSSSHSPFPICFVPILARTPAWTPVHCGVQVTPGSKSETGINDCICMLSLTTWFVIYQKLNHLTSGFLDNHNFSYQNRVKSTYLEPL